MELLRQMVNGGWSRRLKSQRIQNSDSQTPTHITKMNSLGIVIRLSPLKRAKRSTQDESGFTALVHHILASATPW